MPLRSIQGRTPVVHPAAWVAENAYLMGDIEVREGASIWPGAVLRAEMGRIIVGRNAVVLDRCVVHGGGRGARMRTTEIGEAAVLGFGVMLHGMGVGRHSRVGDNATVLEGSIVGEWCYVGARSVVLPRSVVPDYSVVSGVPGEVVGRIDERLQRELAIQGHVFAEVVRLYREADLRNEGKERHVIRSLNGKTPKVHPRAWVSEAAYVVGDVEIGEQCTVFPGAVIRGDLAKIRIGARTNVQDNAVVHADEELVIGENTTLGHAVTVHARRIGSHCLLGNNCTVSEGVEIGDFSVIAAGAVVPPHTVIPPDSFVAGIPGEVLWRTEPARRRMLEETGGENYARLSAIYQAEGLGAWPPGALPPGP